MRGDILENKELVLELISEKKIDAVLTTEFVIAGLKKNIK